MAVCTTSAPADSYRTQGDASRPSRQLLADPGQMTLCVRGPGHDGRLVQIRSPKCTIGSAAGCTLRLRARGVGALHCWILRGPAGTIVRRLHGPATLNGSKFDEAALKSGDRLRIGCVDLELVECNQHVPSPPPLFTPPPPTEAETAALKVALEAEVKRSEEHTSELQSHLNLVCRLLLEKK